jgi:hypothetical protein
LFNDGPSRTSCHVMDEWRRLALLPLISLLMRLRAYESGQERMMDVDDLLRKTVDKVLRRDLHIAR